MKTHYICPKCHSYLRIWNNIIFTVKSSNNKKGLILLNPKLGDYTYLSHPSLKFSEGEKIEFYCPVCSENLAAENINSDLIKIIMIDENKQEFDVYFSKIAGVRTTFKIANNNIVERHGEDTSSYVNYFLRKFEESKRD